MFGSRGKDEGFTVIELVIAASILAFVALAVIGALGFAASANAETTTRESALNLANQRMEQARNIPYDSVGTVNGYPTGTILNSEAVGKYTVATEIGYGRDTDTGLPTSKNIRIVVSWVAPRSGSVSVESNIVGKSNIAYTGHVEVTVIDADTTDPISGVSVMIDPASGPTATSTTKADGTVFWGHVPQGTIAISASKQGYAFSPLSGSVSANIVNKWTMLAYKPSQGTVNVKDQFGNVVVGASVKIVGPSGTFTLATDGSGQAVFADLLKGTYTVTTTGPTGYSAGTGSLGIILGGQSYTTNVTVTKQARLLVTVVDEDGAKVAGATVVVAGAGTATPASASSDANGLTVHSLSAAGAYTATVTKTGYIGASGSKTVASGTDGSLTVAIEKLLPTYFKVKVVDASGVAVSGATVSATGVGSVTPASGTTDASGFITFTVGLPGVYSATASKTGYTTSSGSSPFIANGGTETITITLPIPGVLRVKYTSTPSPNPKTVYIYNSGGVLTGQTLSFTARNQQRSISLAPGTYYVSTKNTYSATAVKGIVTASITTDVSLASTN